MINAGIRGGAVGREAVRGAGHGGQEFNHKFSIKREMRS